MAKGIIVMDMPESCERCQFSHNRIGSNHYCYIVESIGNNDAFSHPISTDQYYSKPDWCPIKPVYSDDTDSANVDKESVILSPKDMIKLLEITPEDDILMVEINDGNDESGVVTDICVGGGTAKGFTYIKVSTDI